MKKLTKKITGILMLGMVLFATLVMNGGDVKTAESNVAPQLKTQEIVEKVDYQTYDVAYISLSRVISEDRDPPM